VYKQEFVSPVLGIQPMIKEHQLHFRMNQKCNSPLELTANLKTSPTEQHIFGSARYWLFENANFLT